MTDLITYIDNTIKNCLTEAKQFGLCHLIESDNEKFPVTIERKAKKAIPDDRFLLCMYHRLLSGDHDPREDASFGKKITVQNKQKIKTIIFLQLGQDDSKIDDIINVLPNSFEMDGYGFVNVNKNITLNRDRKVIWLDEFSDAYRDRYQMKWHIYSFEFNLEYIKCHVCI